MPPKYVQTIREEILYGYAKLMSRSVFKGSLNYGFITDRFKALRDELITMSGTIREWQREQDLPHQCVFCGKTDNLQTDHMIPRARGGTDSADNVVLSCAAYNIADGLLINFGAKSLEFKRVYNKKLVSPNPVIQSSHGDNISSGVLNPVHPVIQSSCSDNGGSNE